MEAAGAAAHPPGGAAQDTGPPLRPPGCCAPPAAAALRAGLDPGDRCGPSAAATTGQARACPRPRTAPPATCRPRMVGTERVIYRQWCHDPLDPGSNETELICVEHAHAYPPDWRLLVDGAGLAGMAVSRVVALRGPGWPGSRSACRPAGFGFRTTCWLAGASPWRGSKEA